MEGGSPGTMVAAAGNGPNKCPVDTQNVCFPFIKTFQLQCPVNLVWLSEMNEQLGMAEQPAITSLATSIMS